MAPTRAARPVVMVAVMTAVAIAPCPFPLSSIDFVLLSQAWLGQDDDPRVDDTGNPAENCEQDIEQELGAASCAQRDGEGREEDCDDCFAAADLAPVSTCWA